MQNYVDPILAAANNTVQPLPALTQPFGTTLVAEPYYFHSVQPNCRTVRTDGKSITFHNHYHKTNIAEDIVFLRKCIAAEPFGIFKEVTGDDVATAEAVLDPKAAQEKAMRAKIIAELVAAGTIPASAMESIANKATAQAAADSADKIESAAAVASLFQQQEAPKVSETETANIGAALIQGTDAASQAAAKLAGLRSKYASGGNKGAGNFDGTATLQPLNALTASAVPLLTPVSTSDLASASASSSSAG